MPTFYEFFAGGGMVRAGLSDNWECLFANDFDEMKTNAYTQNWGAKHLLIGDIRKLSTKQLPGHVDLAWASFPCQDLSLAGGGAGIRAERSGTFWPFWNLMRDLIKEGREPKLIVLENVYGALRSHNGKDFISICSAFSGINYKFGALIIDAAKFLPQSRPRLFIIGVHSKIQIPSILQTDNPSSFWHPAAIVETYKGLSKSATHKWIWWSPPKPVERQLGFIDIIEHNPIDVSWHTQAETKRLLAMMSDVNIAKVKVAQKSKLRVVGGIYKRTRAGIQRAEVRFDNIAGCLRTPAGGSSRQIIIVIEDNKIRTRLLSSREAARLMGLPENYILPKKYNDAYHLAGDGVAVPVVKFLSEKLFLPIIKNANCQGHHEKNNSRENNTLREQSRVTQIDTRILRDA